MLDLFAGREAGFLDAAARLERLMADEGLPYGDRQHTYNSRLAQELAVAGDEAGLTDPLHDVLFHAYFVEGRNLSSLEVLREIAEAAGLEDEVAEAVLLERVNRAAVDGHWQRVLSMGVSGVPTFAAGGYGVVGAQPYEVLEQLADTVGLSKRA